MIYLKLNSLLFLIPFLSLNLLARAEPEKTDPKKSEKAESISFDSLAFYNLQQAYKTEKKSINAPFKEKLLTLIQKNLAEADNLYNEKKKSGNIKGMAIARKAKSIFTKAMEDLQKNGEFELPEKMRKELQENVDKCRNEQKEILKDIDSKFKELDAKYQKKFTEIMAAAIPEGKAPEQEFINKKFQEFLATEIPKPEAEKNAMANKAEMKELGIEVPEQPEKPLSPIIAEKGTGNKWVDIAEWTGQMMGMDIVNIPVLNQVKDYADSQYFPIADADSKLSYKALNPMPEHDHYAFRLKRVPGAKDVDVLEWPSKRNDWNIMVRTRAVLTGETPPIKHSFIFQVSLPDKEFKKIFRGKLLSLSKEKDVETKTTQNKIAKIKITILSQPKGANVYVNDNLYKFQGKTILTPCKIMVPEECNIKISKLGYFDKIYDNFKAVPDSPLKAVLQKDDSIKSYKKNISAAAASWTSSEVKIKTGDQVMIEVEGVWCCTKSTKDKCGPEGIPNTTENYKYYSDSANDQRQLNTAPYGALLMKLSSKDDNIVTSVSGSKKFTATKDAEIFFDINEREGKPRKGNKGSLKITIMVKSEKQ